MRDMTDDEVRAMVRRQKQQSFISGMFIGMGIGLFWGWLGFIACR